MSITLGKQGATVRQKDRVLLVSGVLCAALSGPLAAQPLSERMDPPPGNPDYAALCAKQALSCAARYTGPEPLDLPKPKDLPDFSVPNFGGKTGVGPFVVIGGLLALIVIWLRFGGAGILTRAPREIAPPAIPEGWEDEAAPAPDTIDRLAAMGDRGRALVTLLRMCLLAAAEASATRFARSDTERMALRRLPETLRDRAGLEHILREAELAHYGGRMVPDDRFAALLDQGRGFLRAQSGT